MRRPRGWTSSRPRGWTLADTVVAVTVAIVVLVVTAQVLSSTSRLTRAQAQRSLQQTRLQAVASQIEKTLLGCPTGGVSWQAGSSGAVLAAHTQQSGCVVGSPRWEPSWRCFAWNSSEAQLYLVQRPSPGSTPTPSQSRPQAMEPTQLNALLQDVVLGSASTSARLMANRVTRFSYALEPGPLYRVEIEMDIPNHDEQKEVSSLRLKTVKLINPRL